MKKEYTRDPGHYDTGGRYVHRHAGYFRSVRTLNELRQLHGDEVDRIPVRRRRLNIPTAYDDLNISRSWKRSWKDFTKKRHQWEK